jgi:hypothetical protein
MICNFEINRNKLPRITSRLGGFFLPLATRRQPDIADAKEVHVARSWKG